MTSLDACRELHGWFSKEDTFCLEEDFSKLSVITDKKDRTLATFKVALDDFEKAGIVSKTEIDGKTYWVLKRDFRSMEQTVTISAPLANLFASIINKYCELADTPNQECNPLELKEKDISFLLYLYTEALNQKSD